MAKNLPAKARDVRDTGLLPGFDPLEESMATYTSILAWRIPMDRGAWRAAIRGVGCKELDTTERLSTACANINLISGMLSSK